jgi:hypothetical protein
VRHQFTHIDMTYRAYECAATGRARAGLGYDDVRWIAAEELDAYGIPAPTRRLLTRLFDGDHRE